MPSSVLMRGHCGQVGSSDYFKSDFNGQHYNTHAHPDLVAAAKVARPLVASF